MSRLGKHANIQIYGPTLTVERIAIISFGVYPALDFPVSVDADLKCEDGELYVPVTLLEFAPRSGNQNESRPDLFHLNGNPSAHIFLTEACVLTASYMYVLDECKLNRIIALNKLMLMYNAYNCTSQSV